MPISVVRDWLSGDKESDQMSAHSGSMECDICVPLIASQSVMWVSFLVGSFLRFDRHAPVRAFQIVTVIPESDTKRFPSDEKAMAVRWTGLRHEWPSVDANLSALGEKVTDSVCTTTNSCNWVCRLHVPYRYTT